VQRIDKPKTERFADNDNRIYTARAGDRATCFSYMPSEMDIEYLQGRMEQADKKRGEQRGAMRVNDANAVSCM
jgi:hypothetical protein